MDKRDIESLASAIEKADHLVFFGGAGVSTESGIPDFRGAKGLYLRASEIPPETILSASFFRGDPRAFYNFYRKNLIFPAARPNAAHLFLAALERMGKRVTVITQNVDSLHEEAGSTRVLHLHGLTARNVCLRCHKEYSEEVILSLKDDELPLCPACGGLIKPLVTLYEEPLPESACEAAIEALDSADLLLVAGTSLTVQPAASFLRFYRGKEAYAINLSPLDLPPSWHFVLGRVGTALKEVSSLMNIEI